MITWALPLILETACNLIFCVVYFGIFDFYFKVIYNEIMVMKPYEFFISFYFYNFFNMVRYEMDKQALLEEVTSYDKLMIEDPGFTSSVVVY